MRRKGNAMPKADEAMKELLRASASKNIDVARLAQRELALAIQLPIRQGILDGDIVGENGIFTPMMFTDNQQIEFPLDFIVPGTESEYSAYTIPNYGRIPEKHIEGDYVIVPTYVVGAAIDWSLKYARDARWDIVTRAMQVLESMFVRKINSDAWRCLVAAGVDRNLLVYDSNAPNGFFTKRLISLMKLSMKRYGGGNSASINQIKLTDLYVSLENMEDARSWDLTQVDDVTRREIYLSEDEALSRVFGVDIHAIDELGENQALQNYFTSLGGSLNGSDTELVIGLDLQDRVGTSFVMPIREELVIYEDEGLHRQRRQGYYGWQEHGIAVLDNRRVILGSC